MRSIPEKTLEHWCSIHLTYRYRARLRMWWPTDGQDIDVSGGPLAPGKRFWLELKTTEWNDAQQRHDLTIDLDQLDAYGQEPTPDFYVLPAPPWKGNLGRSPKPVWAGRLDPSDFAYETHSDEQWFAHWLYVIPGSTLRHLISATPPLVLRPNQKTSTAGQTPKRRQRIAEVKNGKFTWLIKKPVQEELLLWRHFWATMEACGDDGPFAAQFILPGGTPGLPSAPSGPPAGPTAGGAASGAAGTSGPVSGPASGSSVGEPAAGTTEGGDAPSTDEEPPSAHASYAALTLAVATLKERSIPDAGKAMIVTLPHVSRAVVSTSPVSFGTDDTEKPVTTPREELTIWTPDGDVFVGQKAADLPSGGEGFVWDTETSRGIILMTIDALQRQEQS